MKLLLTCIFFIVPFTPQAQGTLIFQEIEDEVNRNATILQNPLSTFDLVESPSTATCREQLPSYFDYWPISLCDFGIEKISIRFPEKPLEVRTLTHVRLTASSGNVQYLFTAFYPPVGGLNPFDVFDRTLDTYSKRPFSIRGTTVSRQLGPHDWVFDFTAYDEMQNVYIITRLYVTPFNVYTLQCVKHQSYRDYFCYFTDNFHIKCECGH